MSRDQHVMGHPPDHCAWGMRSVGPCLSPPKPRRRPTQRPPSHPERLQGSVGAPHSRHLLINAIFACAVVIGIFGVLAVWIHRQVLNTNNWTNTSSQLLADPTIEAAVGSLLVNELFGSVDVANEIKSVLPSQVAGLAARGRGPALARHPGRAAGALHIHRPELMAPGQPHGAAGASADPERRQQEDDLDKQRRGDPAAAPPAHTARGTARAAATTGERVAVERCRARLVRAPAAPCSRSSG